MRFITVVKPLEVPKKPLDKFIAVLALITEIAINNILVFVVGVYFGITNNIIFFLLFLLLLFFDIKIDSKFRVKIIRWL